MWRDTGRQVSSFDDDALLAEAVLGGGLPRSAEQQLRAASLTYHLDEVAETHLLEAIALAPDHPVVLIGLYRFYFYKGRLEEALEVAEICLEKAARDNRLPADWRAVRRSDARFGDYEAIGPRFYLFTLKAYAYLQMRLGDLAVGRAALQKLLQIEPSDKLNARLLLDVLERLDETDDD
jgi:tetratricopeptide (TPR) repeat protein